jgi:hypothetical protein
MFDKTTLEELNRQPITIAVVGGANDGKSSTVTTLCHDRHAGFPISNRMGTTTRVKDWNVKFRSTTYMIFRDTPGLQHATDALEAVGFDLHFNVEHVLQFFTRHGHHADLRAVRGAIESDYLLHVVDVTKPPNSNRVHEAAILQRIRPMITLFNFVGDEEEPTHRDDWERMLRQQGIHTFCEFDAHRFDSEREQHLFQKLLASTDARSAHFQAVAGHCELMAHQWSKQIDRSLDAIAELLVDSAVRHARRIRHVERGTWRKHADRLRETFSSNVDRSEVECLKTILEIHDLPGHLLERPPEEHGSTVSQSDEFFTEHWGRWVSGGITAGAVTGATIGGAVDLLSAGTTFGLGTLIGTACGATFGCWRGTLLKTEYDTRDKTITINITSDGLRKLLAHSLQLLSAVRQRGLADVETAFVVGSDAKLRTRLGSSECQRPVETVLECLAPETLIGKTPETFDKDQLKEPLRRVLETLRT